MSSEIQSVELNTRSLPTYSLRGVLPSQLVLEPSMPPRSCLPYAIISDPSFGLICSSHDFGSPGRLSVGFESSEASLSVEAGVLRMGHQPDCSLLVSGALIGPFAVVLATTMWSGASKYPINPSQPATDGPRSHCGDVLFWQSRDVLEERK